jgi:hypothetical protein
MVLRLNGNNAPKAIELIEKFASQHPELDIECIQDFDMAADTAVEKATVRKDSGTDQK